MSKLVTLNNLPFAEKKKPHIMMGRPISRNPMWENQIVFQRAFLQLAEEGYGLYTEDLESLNWWLKHHCASRNDIVQTFLNRRDCDYLVWIDDDMSFDDLARDIKKMIALDKDMVLGVTSCKPSPHVPLLGKFDKIGESGTIVDSTGRHIYDFPTDKPFEVDYGSFGLVCMKRKVLEKMPRPWFYFPPSVKTGGTWGEDITFFFNAKMWGFELWCDPSLECGHLGYTAWHHIKRADHWEDHKEKMMKLEKDLGCNANHELYPEVQKRFKEGLGPKDWWYAPTKTV